MHSCTGTYCMHGVMGWELNKMQEPVVLRAWAVSAQHAGRVQERRSSWASVHTTLTAGCWKVTQFIHLFKLSYIQLCMCRWLLG